MIRFRHNLYLSTWILNGHLLDGEDEIARRLSSNDSLTFNLNFCLFVSRP